MLQRELSSFFHMARMLTGCLKNNLYPTFQRRQLTLEPVTMRRPHHLQMWSCHVVQLTGQTMSCSPASCRTMSRFLILSLALLFERWFFRPITDSEAFVQATANSVRDRLIESWNDNQQFHRDMDSKRVYYLSMEFLMGLSLHLTLMYFFPATNFLGL